MHWLIALMMNLVLLAAPVTEPTKAPRAWDAKTIVWQKVDSDGTKWSVLEGRSDVLGELRSFKEY